MDIKALKGLFSCSLNDWNKHNAPRMGAALAFYTVASISPLVILVLGIVSLVFNKNAAEAQLLDQVQSLIGPQAKESIHTILIHGQRSYGGVLSTIIGVIVLFSGRFGCLPGAAPGPEHYLGVGGQDSFGRVGHGARARAVVRDGAEPGIRVCWFRFW